MANRLLLAVASSAMFLFVAPVAAVPTFIDPNGSESFIFDVHPLRPISAVSFFVQAVAFDTSPGLMFIRGIEIVPGRVVDAFSCSTGFSTTLTECDSFIAGPWSDSVISDGILFLLQITNLGSSTFLVDPYAMITLPSGALVHLDPAIVFTEPEPATLALLGIGLAGLGFSRRKQ